MQPFTTLTAVAVPIDEANVDTNQICPTRFNKVPRGPRYRDILFHDRRFDAGGETRGFILDNPSYRGARIIVADRNWGSGSSRESAVYALWEFGIRCVMAPSFGDIHASNCAKNGLLPVVLADQPAALIRAQLHRTPGVMLTVDLVAQTVTDAEGAVYRFDIHPVRRQCLLEGLDDIDRTGQYAGRFAEFEAGYRAERPWLFAEPGPPGRVD